MVVFDIETDGLYENVSKIWCIATLDTETKEELFFDPVHIKEGIEYLSTRTEALIGHNILGFDFPVISKLYPFFSYKSCYDTLVMSRLYNPDMQHSLDAWGHRIGRHKPVHEDWTKYSEDMKHRCQEDVRINEKVFNILRDRLGMN